MSADFASVVTARTRVVAVIGHPIRHSLSPVIHNAGFRSTGVDFVYVAYDVAPGEGTSAVMAARTLGLAGLSVTMPHKVDIVETMDELGPSARRLKSVNTVSISESGRLVGHSTDGDGFVNSLMDEGVEIANATVAIFGAGGAAVSVIDALDRSGISALSIVNRTRQSAVAAAQLTSRPTRVVDPKNETEVEEVISGSRLLVNATSIGMGSPATESTGSEDLPFDPELLTPDHIVVDLVYHPLETPLLNAARRQGCRTVGGLGMLIHQAALQQEIWTGHTPDIAAMARAARRALN